MFKRFGHELFAQQANTIPETCVQISGAMLERQETILSPKGGRGQKQMVSSHHQEY